MQTSARGYSEETKPELKMVAQDQSAEVSLPVQECSGDVGTRVNSGANALVSIKPGLQLIYNDRYRSLM